MTLSVFTDKSSPPSDADVAKALGAARDAWRDLIARVAKHFSPLEQTWGFTSRSTGWGMRLQHAGRTILYMTPREGSFLVSFVLGEKAVQAAHAGKLPKRVLDAIDSAKKYAEGRGVRFEARTLNDIAPFETLALLKMS